MDPVLNDLIREFAKKICVDLDRDAYNQNIELVKKHLREFIRRYEDSK